MRVRQPEPYWAGQASGRELALKVTDLTHHTERLQVAELRIPDVVPLDVPGRREWLGGYAAGILAVLASQEQESRT
jgi:hypothetical protein